MTVLQAWDFRPGENFVERMDRAMRESTEDARLRGKTPRMSWVRLLKRVFDIDIQHCLHGGALKIIAAPSIRCSAQASKIRR